MQTSHFNVIIIGAGFGGLQAARAVNKATKVLVIDRNNHHLFQPLLYQVATAGLSPGDIAAPIRRVLRNQRNTEVLMAKVEGVDVAAHEVSIEGGRRFRYDQLIIATGARHSYFGNDRWETFAPGLKSVADATEIRKRILLAYENAELESDAVRRKALLTMVIVGAGPTGVELAGSIAELAHRAVKRDFRNFDPGHTRILLVEAAERILGAFPTDLAAKAELELKRLGVEVMTATRVEEIDATGVTIRGERVPAATVIWAAGVRASPAGEWLDVETDRAGRVRVDRNLQVPGLSNVYLIGDTACAFDEEGEQYPGVAAVAMQQGRFVAKRINELASGRAADEAFRYTDKGSLATIGRKYAIGVFRKVKFRGVIAWLVWLVVHIMYLIGFRNRMLVLFQWFWAYTTYQRGVRLIVPETLSTQDD